MTLQIVTVLRAKILSLEGKILLPYDVTSRKQYSTIQESLRTFSIYFSKNV